MPTDDTVHHPARRASTIGSDVDHITVGPITELDRAVIRHPMWRWIAAACDEDGVPTPQARRAHARLTQRMARALQAQRARSRAPRTHWRRSAPRARARRASRRAGTAARARAGSSDDGDGPSDDGPGAAHAVAIGGAP